MIYCRDWVESVTRGLEGLPEFTVSAEASTLRWYLIYLVITEESMQRFDYKRWSLE